MNSYFVKFKLGNTPYEEVVYANDTCSAKDYIRDKFRGSNVNIMGVFTESQSRMMRHNNRQYEVRYRLNGRNFIDIVNANSYSEVRKLMEEQYRYDNLGILSIVER